LTPLPANLLEHLITTVRQTQKLDPASLRALAGLTFFQFQSLTRLGYQIDRWRRDLNVAAFVSLPAQQQLLAEGVTWEKLPPRDRALVAQLAGTPPGADAPDYSARLMTQLRENPAAGGTEVSLAFLHYRNPGWALDLF